MGSKNKVIEIIEINRKKLLINDVSHRMLTTIYCWLSIVGENYGRKICGNDRLRIPRRSRENCYSWLSVEDAL